MHRKPTLSISLTLFTAAFLVFFFTLLNGYALNLVSDYRANAWLVGAGLVIEMLAVFWLARRWVKIEIDALELAGFLLVVLGVWAYFVSASLPTFLPPTLSNDAVRVYLQSLFSFPEGKLVSWYPAGGAFVVAMFSHWLGWDPLRVLHPTAALILALSAGALYGMTCELLRTQFSRFSRPFAPFASLAFLAPAALFIPWTYFAGILNWEQYFFAQAFAQYFIIAAWWFAARYAIEPSPIFAALFGAALLGIVAAYPYFVPLALALFVLTVLLARSWRGSRLTLVALIVFVALVALAALAIQRGGILEIAASGRIATESAVGEGGVASPSLDTLGGPIFLLLALAGIPFAWRAGARGRALIALLLAWVLQFAVLILIQPLFKISDYRVDKTFYLLVYPLALLSAMVVAHALNRAIPRVAARARLIVFVAMVVGLSAAVVFFRPPKPFTPLTESEIQTARWAKGKLDTYQIAYLDPQPIRAYWLTFGIWRESVPNEWFQWIPRGNKMGPPTLDEWLTDPAWHPYVLARAPFDARARVVHQIGDSAILEKPAPPRVDFAPQVRLPWVFGSTLKLLGYDLARPIAQAGVTLTFTTYVESIYPPPATVGWRAELVDRSGNVVGKAEADPFANKYPLERWPLGKIARDTWSLPIDANAAAGAYELRLGLYRRENGEPIGVWHASEADAVHKQLQNAAPIARIKIPLVPPSAEELAQAQPLDARIGENFSLARYALTFDRAARSVRLSLYWRGITRTETDYTVFVHVLDAAGKIIAQKDVAPREGSYPTSIWDANEWIRDDYAFALDAAPPYQIEIGMYSQRDLARLAVYDASGAWVGDRVLLEIK